MSPEAQRDWHILAERLSAIRDRWRTSLVLAGGLQFMAGLLLLVLALAGAEALCHFPGGVRWALLALAVMAAAAGLGLLVARPMVERISLERIARLAETRRPDLGNLLIAGLQLRSAVTPAPALAAAALAQAAECSVALDPSVTVDRRRLLRLGQVAGGSLLALAVCFAVAPGRMTSALKRLAMPGTFVPQVGSVRILAVSPEDQTVLAGSDVTVTVTVAATGGARAPDGRIFYRESRGPEFERRLEYGGPAASKGAGPAGEDPQQAQAESYVYVLRNVERDVRYRAEVGDSQTRLYRLTVVERPEVREVDLACRYPDYTGRAREETRNVKNREIRVPAGTAVSIAVRTNRPVAHARLDFSEGPPLGLVESAGSLVGSFTVEKSGAYAIFLEDAGGHRNLNPPSYPIVAVPDAPPAVRVLAPGRDLELPAGATLAVAIHATDDYGMKSVALRYRRNRGGELQKLAEWKDFPDPRSAQLVHRWTLSTKDFDPGDVIFYHAEAADRIQTGQSPTFQVKLVDPKKAAAERLKDLAEFVARLKKVLEKQVATRAEATELFRKPPADDRKLLGGAAALAASQQAVRRDTIAAAEVAPLDDSTARKVRSAVLLLAAGPELEAEKAAAALAASAQAAREPAGQNKLTGQQDAVIKTLRELLAIVEKLEAQASKEDLKNGSDLPDDAKKVLENLAEKLKNFIDEQKKVIEATQDLAKTPVEDLTEEQKKKQQALAATEDKWEKFLKDAASDLSKLQKQDFTDPQLLKELVETYSEVEMAKDALTKKTAEIAVPIEQSGLELAEALTTHIEKWLPDTPDREQWKMEEPLGENQTPMAELPHELEDLVGDLMEEQEDIFEEMEDATSAWADSLDKGAGWDALDGPISNMSAQGVTGNRLPNSSEINGRSGEGRTGKAAGEFVEDSATGKGGRNTPTRLTPDAFLKGDIKDTSKDPAGGSTGGGKVGGGGGEGLEGPPPPEVQKDVGRLAGKQAQILSRAERLALELKVRNQPTADIDRVINLMRAASADLKDGRYENLARKRNVMLQGLKTTRDFAAAESRVQQDNSSALPKRLRDELFDAMEGGVPAGYEELVKRYYESISKAGD